MAEEALFDVKVVDLSQHVAGPFCTKLFADYGAEVIKIEKPDGGDVCRTLGPFPGDIPHPEKSGLFLHLNTNKKSVTLNLKTETGKKILKELVKDADLLVESYPPKEAQSLGVSYEEMEKVNPRLVMASITNFGQTGPYRDYRATDMLIYAAGGVLYVTGDGPDREPNKIANYAPLLLGGNQAAALSICALYGGRFHGLGQHVDISLQEIMAGSIDRGGPNLLAVAYSGDLSSWRAPSTRTNLMPPAAAIPCADGYIYAMNNANMWPAFCHTIGHPEFLTDPRFQNIYNLDLLDEMDAMILEYTMQHTKEEIAERAQSFGWGVAPINTPEDVFRDRQLREQGFYVEVEHPGVGRYEALGAPFKMAETPWQASRAPLLGEHNEEILCGRLGYTKQDLVLLRERGII